MKVEPVGPIRTIQSPTAEGVSDTIVATVTTIVTTTVGAGVLLVILFQVLLIIYKRRKKTVVNIPMETVDTPQEPLPNDQVNCVLLY